MRTSGWGGRLALLLGGFLAAAVLLEAGLQTLAWMLWVSDHRPRARSGWATDGHRVLCLGDSNTFGLAVSPEHSYPSQLEALWNERVREPRIEVMNLGYPGTNSSAIAAQLPGLLEAIDPDTILLMVGANDFWTLPFRAGQVPGQDRPGRRPGTPGTAMDSRLLRLFALLRGRLSRIPEEERLTARVMESQQGRLLVARQGDVEFELGSEAAEKGSEVGNPQTLRLNLDAILATARGAGATPVLLTYPSSRTWYAIASERMRAAGRASGTRIVDLERVFAPVCPEGDCDLLIEDGHPTPKGYGLVADTIVKERPFP
jgi:lysophospholipase L1-like esterase